MDHVQSHIAAMLDDGLNMDDAIRIALANNRTLQARYEELDIAASKRFNAGNIISHMDNADQP